MIFRSVDYSEINIHGLGICNFPRGSFVFSLGLVFFLCITKQYKAMKIDFIVFRAKMDLLCISEVPNHFCVFLIWLKRIYTRVLLTGQGRLRWILRGLHVAADWTGDVAIYLTFRPDLIWAVGFRSNGGERPIDVDRWI